MLTWIDIALLVILGLSAVMGLWRGLVTEVMSLAVWIGAGWLAFVAGPAAAAMFEPHIGSPTARWALGYASVFLAALMVGALLVWLIQRLVKGTGLSGTDRLLGLGFGLARGAFIGCLLVLVAGFTPLPQEAAWRASPLLPGFSRGAAWMGQWLPEALAEHLSFERAAAWLPALPVPGENDAPGAAPEPAASAPADATPRPDPPRDS
ncbi:MAG TPA: CvpA family protein [Chiayiivirga sp.]|nr:CvpA family protein [Chiayiivirga sp.]